MLEIQNSLKVPVINKFDITATLLCRNRIWNSPRLWYSYCAALALLILQPYDFIVDRTRQTNWITLENRFVQQNWMASSSPLFFSPYFHQTKRFHPKTVLNHPRVNVSSSNTDWVPPPPLDSKTLVFLARRMLIHVNNCGTHHLNRKCFMFTWRKGTVKYENAIFEIAQPLGEGREHWL